MNNNFLLSVISVSLLIWIFAWFYIGGGKSYNNTDIQNFSSQKNQISSSVSSYYDDFEISFSQENIQKNTDFNFVENQISQPLAKIISSGTNIILKAPHGDFDITKLVGVNMIYPDQVKDLGGYYFSGNGKTYHIGKNNIELITGDYKILANNLAQNSGSLIFGAKKISDKPLENYKLVGNILFDQNQKFYFSPSTGQPKILTVSGSIEYISGLNYLIDGKKYLIDEFGDNIVINRIFNSDFDCLDIFLCKDGKNVFALYFSQDKLSYYGNRDGQLLKGVNGENFQYLGLEGNTRYYYNGVTMFIIKQNSRFRKLEKLSNSSKNRILNECQGEKTGICKKLQMFSSGNF